MTKATARTIQVAILTFLVALGRIGATTKPIRRPTANPPIKKEISKKLSLFFFFTQKNLPIWAKLSRPGNKPNTSEIIVTNNKLIKSRTGFGKNFQFTKTSINM